MIDQRSNPEDPHQSLGASCPDGDKTQLDARAKIGLILVSGTWFFLVLTAYYFLKPVRDGLGSTLSGRLGDLYLATFICTLVGLALYSKLVATVSRLKLVFCVHQFFAICLLLFYFAFSSLANREGLPMPPWLIATFFVWVSVFNLFVVTLFWSVMADIYSSEESKSWFGWIAAGGSIGSLCGSSLAYFASRWLGVAAMLLIAIAFLELAIVLAFTLDRMRKSTQSNSRQDPIPAHEEGQKASDRKEKRDPESEVAKKQSEEGAGTGGSIYAGFALVIKSRYLIVLCLFVLLGKFSATFVYNNLQLVMSAEVADSEQRVQFFSSINFLSQLGSLILQSLVAGWMMSRMGVRATLVLPTFIVMAFFLWLIYRPDLNSLMAAQVIQQCLAYGLLVPAQNALFTVVTREEKYKSKAFTDTVVFRGSDVLAGKLCQWMTSQNLPLGFLSGALIPVVGIWAFLAFLLGSMYQSRRNIK